MLSVKLHCLSSWNGEERSIWRVVVTRETEKLFKALITADSIITIFLDPIIF